MKRNHTRKLLIAYNQLERIKKYLANDKIAIGEVECNELLRKKLELAIDLLASAWMIADRKGEKTNWPVFKKRLDVVLKDIRETLHSTP